MKKDNWFIGILACLACLPGLTSCHDSASLEEVVQEAVPSPVVSRLVNLNLTVALAESGAPELSSDDVYPEGPTAECEKMHSLRVIVVRPSGKVEVNSTVTFLTPGVKYTYEPFKVVGGEKKKIYFIVNESVLGEDGRPLLDYNFRKLFKGSVFPTEVVENLLVNLPEGVRMTGNLPMSECHEVDVPEEDSEVTLFVTRAAVKYTFNITNNSSQEFRLTGLSIDSVADREYLLPRNADYQDYVTKDGIPFKDIVSYDMPAETEYYRLDVFGYAGVTAPVALEPGRSVTVDKPVYHLESLYHECPYNTSGTYKVNLDAETTDPRTAAEFHFSTSLPNLPRLPRNTWVKVNISLGDAGIKWQVDVRPYTGLTLDPVFGL